MAQTTGMSIGHAVMLVGVGLVIAALSLRSWPGPGTVLLPFLGGWILDAVLPVTPVIPGVGLRVAVVVAATWVMALGGALVIWASFGIAAYDAVMFGLRRLTGRALAPIRLAMELTMLACGWLLGGTVGVGTVITAVLIGPGIQFWLRMLGSSPVRSTPSPQPKRFWDTRGYIVRGNP